MDQHDHEGEDGDLCDYFRAGVLGGEASEDEGEEEEGLDVALRELGLKERTDSGDEVDW